MKRGIYILGNNRVRENAIALLNSIRLYDREIPVYLVPFDDQYQELLASLQPKGVELFPNLDKIQQLSQKMKAWFPEGFFSGKSSLNKLRKFNFWLGPLDEFLYIDTDIVVFEKVADILDYLSEYEFLCCDFQHKGGLKNIFNPVVREKEIFTDSDLQYVFNSGLFASRKNIISESRMDEILQECSNHREYFDFTNRIVDQPLLNYMVLKCTSKRLNLVRVPGCNAGSWAGSSHFQQVEPGVLYDGNRRLKYLHWAGRRPKDAYQEIWEYYRYMYEPKPEPVKVPFWQQIWTSTKHNIKTNLQALLKRSS
ncbi:Npun_R2821/Npun_R2822 family protein [Geitlerinema sp. PCC 9228]|jgi:hypothetical protein|uniref:Npun_R2821/Npun_R2822 family protein n=1 Tax=Geitlerinema sp. PCC 9228 TaxID=111611 RepID=UPI0008F9B1FC|nr:Npun_R2821/Npun_R2822 family protein [Geitlerinema sp. PCC 9228]